VKSRLEPFETAPKLMQALLDLEKKVRSSGLESSLIQLLKTRASLLNGCAFCVHRHARDARAAGEELASRFTEVARVKLSLLIVTINCWNRIAVGSV
jgi:AhpD family alkylhydroperoxidase